jgi:hypothetical protein
VEVGGVGEIHAAFFTESAYVGVGERSAVQCRDLLFLFRGQLVVGAPAFMRGEERFSAP